MKDFFETNKERREGELVVTKRESDDDYDISTHAPLLLLSHLSTPKIKDPNKLYLRDFILLIVGRLLENVNLLDLEPGMVFSLTRENIWT